MSNEIVVMYARDAFWYDHQRVDAGSVWPADDPVVLARPGQFTSDPSESPMFRSTPGHGGPVEQATAAPGERRNIRRVQR